MKIFTSCFLFFFLASAHVFAQKIVVDSSFSSAYLKEKAPVAAEKKEEKAEEGLGDLALRLGEGIWKRLKYRLNLDGIKEGLEAKKEKYAGGSETDEEPENESGG